MLLTGEKEWILEHHCVKGLKLTLTQLSGDLLWVPPGWYHSVRTVNKSDKGLQKVKCADGRERNFAISMPFFHTPKPLRELALLSWGQTVNEEQSDYFNGRTIEHRVADPNAHFGSQKLGQKKKVLIEAAKREKALEFAYMSTEILYDCRVQQQVQYDL